MSDQERQNRQDRFEANQGKSPTRDNIRPGDERIHQGQDAPVDPAEEVDGVEDALTKMQAHEQRRDQEYRTTGDNQSPGVDVDIDSNAPTYDQERRK